MTLKVSRRARFAGRKTSSKDSQGGELIRLRHKIKTENVSEEAGLLASLDQAAADLDAGKGLPLEDEALDKGLREKAEEFQRAGSRRLFEGVVDCTIST